MCRMAGGGKRGSAPLASEPTVSSTGQRRCQEWIERDRMGRPEDRWWVRLGWRQPCRMGCRPQITRKVEKWENKSWEKRGRMPFVGGARVGHAHSLNHRLLTVTAGLS